MRVQLRRESTGFQPDSQHDYDELASVHIRDVVTANVRLARNPAHHRKAFAMLHKIYDNLPEPMHVAMPTFEKFYSYMKVAAGAVDDCIGHDGKAFYVVKSLSFADMDQMEFDRIYNQFITVAYERLSMEWVLEEFA